MGHLNPKMESNLVIIVIKQNVLAHLLGVKSQRGFPPAHCVWSHMFKIAAGHQKGTILCHTEPINTHAQHKCSRVGEL